MSANRCNIKPTASLNAVRPPKIVVHFSMNSASKLAGQDLTTMDLLENIMPI